MEVKEIYNNILNQKIYFARYPSKLRAYVLLKEGFSKQYAVFATHYGSIDNVFKGPGDNDFTMVPDGIAHFLEHKLFEQEDIPVFEKFSKLGGSPNAYTNYNTTAYLFSSANNFYENLELLLDFVQKPYLTDRNVEKEKGIIGQEIKMYQDNPNARVFRNLLGCLYVNNPINKDIAGTIESIKKINKDILYKCYNTFYNPSNMVLFATGDIDQSEVFKIIDNKVNKRYNGKVIKEKIKEPKTINSDYTEINLSVSIPLFSIGFKDTEVGLKGDRLLNKIITSNIILDMLFGKSSEFYNSLYNQGLLNDNFGTEYIGDERYCFLVIEGESNSPHIVKQKVLETINFHLEDGLDEKVFNRIKNMNIGKFITQFDNLESISHAFINCIFNDIIIFDYINILNTLTFEHVSKRLDEMFDMDKMAMSVVNPM